jgi:peptide-methionine (S)-S-oxide reductase
LPGVIRTRVGYTGGTHADPTYYNLGDHTESIQVDYDPEQISFEQLLQVFWEAHNPLSRPYSRQYMAAVFYEDEEQKRLSEASRGRVAAELGGDVFTQVLPAGTFYLAEDYHQKYNLRRYQSIYDEIAAVYPQTEQVIASTAAARINGYLGGYSTRAQLEEELAELGLSQVSADLLLRTVNR